MNKIVRNILLVIVLSIIVILFFIVKDRELPSIDKTENIYSNSGLNTDNIEKGIQSPSKLSAHFYDEYIPPPVVAVEEPVVVEVDNTPKLTNEIKYISTIIKSDVESYYFKNTRSGRIITLTKNQGDDNWSIASIEENFFILQSGEQLYKVPKK